MTKPPAHNFGRWFRFYIRSLDDLKVQAMSGDLFKTWVNLLSLAAEQDGALPDIATIAFRLRLSEKEAQRRIAALVSARLMDKTQTGLVPHDWDERQFKSDGSAERMRRYRERHKSNDSDVTVTSPPSPKPVTRDGPSLSLSLKSVSVSDSAYQDLDSSQLLRGDQ